MLAMHAASGRLADELQAVPAYIISDAAAPAQAAAIDESLPSAKSMSPHKAVTTRYLQVLCQHVKRSDKSALNELAVIISDEGLPGNPADLDSVMKSWADSGLQTLEFSDEVTEDECKDTALNFYVLVTEVIGPVETDVLVNKAIAEVVSMDASQQFDPRGLL